MTQTEATAFYLGDTLLLFAQQDAEEMARIIAAARHAQRETLLAAERLIEDRLAAAQ